MSADEMRKTKRGVKRIRGDLEWPKNLGFGFLFLSPAFYVTWTQWTPIYEELSPASQLAHAGTAPFLLISAAASFVIAVLCFAFHLAHESARKIDKDHVLDLLETIEDRHEVPVTERESRTDPPEGIRGRIVRLFGGGA